MKILQTFPRNVLLQQRQINCMSSFWYQEHKSVSTSNKRQQDGEYGKIL